MRWESGPKGYYTRIRRIGCPKHLFRRALEIEILASVKLRNSLAYPLHCAKSQIVCKEGLTRWEFSPCDKVYDSEVDRTGNALEMRSNLIVLGSREEIVKEGIEWSIILVSLVVTSSMSWNWKVMNSGQDWVGKEFKLRFRTRSAWVLVVPCDTAHLPLVRPGLCFARINFSIHNPILMLIYDFGMLIVGIQAVPSLKWHLLLRCSTDHSVSTILPRVTHQALYWTCTNTLAFFFLFFSVYTVTVSLFSSRFCP